MRRAHRRPLCGRRAPHTARGLTGANVRDPKYSAAIVDRLTYHGTIIETGTHSYRLAHSRTQATATG